MTAGVQLLKSETNHLHDLGQHNNVNFYAPSPKQIHKQASTSNSTFESHLKFSILAVKIGV